MQDFIELATKMADEAGKIIRPYFRANVDVEAKKDESPVTIADKSVEERLRAIIEEHRPEDGIIGEEFGIKEGKNKYTWVLDPIDGTKSFVIGRPTFGTLIALCEDGVPILGIIDQPISKERWIGVKGQATTFNGQPVKTRPCIDLKEARIASTSPSMMPDQWPKLYDECGMVVWGGDCYSYGLIASGFLNLVVEKGLNLYDFAAIPPIIEGAGGFMCDWNGESLTLNSDDAVVAGGDIALKDQILSTLNS